MKTYFNNINTAEELKNQFRTLCQTMHPDKGGNAQEFAEMLNEYESKLKTAGAWTKQERAQVDEWAEILTQCKKTTRGAALNVGDFITIYDTMEKSNDLRDAVASLVRYRMEDKTAEEYKVNNITVGKIEAVIYMSDEDLQKFPFMDEKPAGAGNGGSVGPIYDSEKKPRDMFGYDPQEHAHYYSYVTAIITPSRVVFIDCEGYNYARCVLLPEYFDEFPEYRAEVEAIEAEKRAKEEAERKAEEERKARDLAAVKKWAGILEEIPAVGSHDWSKEGRKARQQEEAKQKAAFKRNIKAVFNHYFPGVKVTVKDTNPTYYKESCISWVDGPTVAEVEAVPEWSQFLGWEYYKEDPYDDYSQRGNIDEFETFREKFGEWSANNVNFYRTLSEAEKAKAEAKACESFPQLATDEARATECGKGVIITHSEAYAAAAFFGLSFWAGVDPSTLTEEERDELNRKDDETENARRHFVRFVSSDNRYNEKINIYDVLKIFAEFWKVEAPKAAQTTTRKAEPQKTQNEPTGAHDAEILAAPEGLELVEIAEGVAVVGDTRTTYRNRKAIKAHGATWNRDAQQWQATTPEAVASLRQWFGLSDDEPQAEKKAEPQKARGYHYQMTAENMEQTPQPHASNGSKGDALANFHNIYNNSENLAEGVEVLELGEWFAVCRHDGKLYAQYIATEAEAEKAAEDVREILKKYTDNTTDTQNAPQQDTTTAEDAETVRPCDLWEDDTTQSETTTDSKTAEAMARVALALVELCHTLEDIAKAQQAEAEKTAQEARKAEAEEARKAEARALRESIATLSAQLAQMGDTLRQMSERLAQLEQDTADTLHDAEEITDTTNEPTEPTDPGNTPTGGAPEGGATMTEAEREQTRQHFERYARHAEEATDNNEHTAALCWQITALIWNYGNTTIKAAELLYELENIKERHEKRGHLTPEDRNRRDEIHDEIILLCVREYGADLAAVLFGRGTVAYVMNEQRKAA